MILHLLGSTPKYPFSGIFFLFVMGDSWSLYPMDIRVSNKNKPISKYGWISKKNTGNDGWSPKTIKHVSCKMEIHLENHWKHMGLGRVLWLWGLSDCNAPSGNTLVSLLDTFLNISGSWCLRANLQIAYLTTHQLFQPNHRTHRGIIKSKPNGTLPFQCIS